MESVRASFPGTESAAFAAALLSGDRRSAMAIACGLLDRRHNLPAIEVGVLQSALYEIGDRWQMNQVTVAQEHLATAIAQTVMAELFSRATFSASNGLKAVFTGTVENHHVVGLRMVADAFELAGWEAQYLGANLPADALMAHIDHSRPALIGLSASMPQQLPAVREIVTRLKSEFASHAPTILVGGLAFNRTDGAWRDVGAELWVPDAVAAHRLAGEAPITR